jgi:hypothetical protein
VGGKISADVNWWTKYDTREEKMGKIGKKRKNDENPR